MLIAKGPRANPPLQPRCQRLVTDRAPPPASTNPISCTKITASARAATSASRSRRASLPSASASAARAAASAPALFGAGSVGHSSPAARDTSERKQRAGERKQRAGERKQRAGERMPVLLMSTKNYTVVVERSIGCARLKQISG